MVGGKFSGALLHGMTIRESANDGSDFTNPAADYRRVFLGEDGELHSKDSAGAVAGFAGSGIQATLADAAGDMLVASGADAWAKLARGAEGTVPRSNGTTLVSAYPTAGRVRFVTPDHYDHTVAVTSANLGINGGTFAIPLTIPGLMLLDALRYRNFDTATARSIEFALLRDDGSANAVCVAVGTDSFTPGAASNRAPAFTSAPVTVPPGDYWLAIRNTGGATNFTISIQAANATNIGLVVLQSQTLAGALPAVASTLDMTTGWTRTSVNQMAVALIGRVFGEGSSF